MNIKQFCSMIYKDTPIKITVGAGEESTVQLDINSPLQVQLYGNYKIACIRALGVDAYEISLEIKPAEIVVEP